MFTIGDELRIMNRIIKTDGPMSRVISIDVDGLAGQPYVHIVYSGINRLPETHKLIVICSKVENAIRIADARQHSDKVTWGEDESLEFWVESIPVDHMFGSACIDKAKRQAWRRKEGD